MLRQLLVLVSVVGLIAGVIGLTRRVGFAVPFAFIATYTLCVGALTFLNIGAFDMVDAKFREMWVTAWLQIYWPLWTVFFAPSAICALLANWFSGATGRRDAVIMLGVFLGLILIAIEIQWTLDAYIGRYGFWPLLSALTILGAMFFAIGQVARVRRANEPLPVRVP